MTGDAIDVDGLRPASILIPQSVEELSQALRAAHGAIVPYGSRTQMYFGNPLRAMDCAVDLTCLSRITEYNPSDLTIHVQAGVTLQRLQETLLENNQFLPLDPWNGSLATIGGIAATNAQGPFRAAGTLRDWIIGMRVVQVDGQISKTGGRVVKNVTGYDLARLFTGSIGSLAIIAELSLKLRTTFQRKATAVRQFENRAAAAATIKTIRTGPLQPVSFVWTGPENFVWLRFGEHSRAVDWQLKNLPEGDWAIEEDAAWEKVRQHFHSMSPIVVKVVGVPSTLFEIIEEYQPTAWIAHALNGIVLMAVSSPVDVRRIRERYPVVIERAPLEVRRAISTFGLTGAEYGLTKKMKDAFDPQGRLNPGRHVDGERNA